MRFKKWIFAIVLSVVWWIFAFAQVLGLAYRPREEGILDKIIILPFDIGTVIFENIQGIFIFQKGTVLYSLLSFASFFMSIIILSIILIMIYKMLKALKELKA